MFDRLKAFIGQSEFAKNILMLTSGTALAQAFPILVSPILTRIYSPDEFAVYGLYSALISILGVVSTGKYEFAIMLPDTDAEGMRVGALTTLIVLLFGGLLLINFIVFHDFALQLLKNEGFSLWIYVVPAGVILTGFYQVLSFWNNRKKRYELMAKARVVRAVVSNLVSIFLGLAQMGMASMAAFGLIIGLIMGQIIELKMLVRLRSLTQLRNQIQILGTDLKALARRYVNFPRYDVPSEIMVTGSVQLPVLLLNRFFEQAVVGLYFHAHKVLSLPISIIGSSIGQVLFKQLADVRHDHQTFTSLVSKAYSRLMLIGVIPFSIVGVFGPELFAIVFGGPWRQAGIFAALISPWLLFNFVGSPLTVIFSAMERQKQMLYWITCMFLLRVASLFIGFLYFKDVYYAIFLFSASGTIFYFFMNLYIVCVLSRVRFQTFARQTFLKPALIVLFICMLKYSFNFFLTQT